MTATGAVAVAVESLRLSASQIQTFVDCKRKWGWRYVAGIEEPSSPAAEKGRAVHAELEKYLTGGEIDFTTEIGYIAASGLMHLPKPGSYKQDPENTAVLRWVPTEGMLVEQEFHFFGPSGHSYLGYKDLEVPGTIFDHKSTSDLRWQKTPDDLKTDIQATLYAVDYFRKHPAENDVELRWVYYQTRGTRKSAVTHLRVAQHEAWARFLEIEKIAEEMREASTKKPLELPPSIDHCSAYGGCPHQGRCNLSPFDKMRAYVQQQRTRADHHLAVIGGTGNNLTDQIHANHPRNPMENPLISKLKAKKANGAAAAPPAPTGTVPLAFAPGGGFHGLPVPGTPGANTPPAAAPPAAGAPANKLLAKMRASGAPASTTPAAAPPAPPAAQFTLADVQAALASGQTLSGEMAAAAQAFIAQAAAGVPAVTTPGQINPPEFQPPPTAAPAAAAATAAAATAAAAPAADAGAAPVAEKRTRAAKAVVPATGLAVKIKTLFINCGPVGANNVTDASQLIMLAKKRIAEAGVADYRFADFGQGPGMLVLAVIEALDAIEGEITAVRLDTYTPEGSIIAVELMARAGLVVR